MIDGVTFQRALSVVFTVLAAAAATTPTGRASGVQLDKLVLRASQIGPGYTLHKRPDGHGVAGFVTLDMCGYRFTSEALRTGRLQVNYTRKGTAIGFSNEVVTYAPGGTRLAVREMNQAVNRCPTKPVPSTVQGVPPLTYRITRLSTAGLLPGAIALRVRISGVYKGKPLSETDTLVYQVRGNILSGVYAYGGPTTVRDRAALNAARQSRLNLLG